MSGFIEKHPGGARQLLLGAGRDITMIFESYHHFNNSMYRLILILRMLKVGILLCLYRVLEKYYVGELVTISETRVRQGCTN